MVGRGLPIDVLLQVSERSEVVTVILHFTSTGYDVVVCTDSHQAPELAAEMHPSAITLDIVCRRSRSPSLGRSLPS